MAALIKDYPARAALQRALAQAFDLERVAQKVRIRRVEPARPRLAAAHPRPARARARGGSARAARGGAIGIADASGVARAPGAHARRRAAGATLRRRRDPSRSFAGTQSLRRACAATPARGLNALEERERTRTGIKIAQDQVLRRVRLRVRDRQEQSRRWFRRIRPQADVDQRGAVRDARTQRIGERDQRCAVAPAAARGGALRRLVEPSRSTSSDLLETADALAEIDVAASLAQAAAERGYVRPAFVDARTIEMRGRPPSGDGAAGGRRVRPQRPAAAGEARRASC